MPMDMLAKRSNYTLLSQVPDDQCDPVTGAQTTSLYESFSGEDNNINKGKVDRGFDWDAVGDHRRNRIGNVHSSSSIGPQRQSSGSSFGESSLSGEYFAPTPSTEAVNNIDGVGNLHDVVLFRVGGAGKLIAKASGNTGGESSSGKSWALQTEESYQLQLALALRLPSEATCVEDPNFLDLVPDESAPRTSSAEVMSHRFWVNGCLSYFDKVPDGFYLIHGMDPYAWAICPDLQESGRIPSIESVRSVRSASDSSIEVVLIDQRTDTSLKELQDRVLSISSSCITTKEVVNQLAKLVCNLMGGSASMGENDFVPIWKECSDDLKDSLGSVVVPIGSLSVGLCRHHAILFKVRPDTIDLPCRIAKGCKYCTRDDAPSCLVRFGLYREYLLELIGKPGYLCEPDSLLNGPSSISISSPLRFSRLKAVEPTIDFRSLAKQYFSYCQLLNITFHDASTDPGPKQQHDIKCRDKNHSMLIPSDDDETSCLALHSAQLSAHDRDSELFKSCNPAQNITNLTTMVKDTTPLNSILPIGHKDVQPLFVLSNPRVDAVKDSRFSEGGQLVPGKSRVGPSLDIEYFDIQWSDLVLKERIGAGSFGTVHRADWHGSDVAVKILTEQDFHAEHYKEFLREVTIMKHLRHPNIVLFMGAVTRPPNLSIVIEYLSRGSLYRLLHKPDAREMLDERRRLNTAYDVAKGMNYLHKRHPPIVHQDLKSPNLLVDKKYTVKVCDFGLSRLKANTFLSSKSAAGTPEWMAPEALCDEPSNEKSDVYSFGIILWELATLQRPWSNLNPVQVVAAVGFKGKRLEIPHDLNPQVASIIEACCANEPWKRPSFSSIMESLRPLIKPPLPQPDRADMALVT
ncbi:serine/threonine-protein kinase CTR1-like [Carya illinoinensis]|uniref:serine/threonine-protein kinase CTR1-like n=1 Tax=Carya illinoinensis TaxID=32201 RepID=UPI001C726673|nr:serine/threonine-protein kinase CTR1-like [Carya illinoinensis]